MNTITCRACNKDSYTAISETKDLKDQSCPYCGSKLEKDFRSGVAMSIIERYNAEHEDSNRT